MKHTDKRRFIYVVGICAILVLLLGGILSRQLQAGTGSASAASFVRNYHQLKPDLATGGFISSGGLKALAEDGVQTIIDLRQPEEGIEEERQEAQKKGIIYINIPVGGSGVLPHHVAAFSKAYEEARLRGPVLLHCASGNRVGGLWTAYQLKQSIKSQQAFEEGRIIGMKPSLEESIKDRFCKLC